MFADMVGYTALMQTNESIAKDKRMQFRRILDENVKDHHGQLIQSYGDGALVTFQSAIDAVRCGINLQQRWTTDPQVEVRIGIHLGDVTIEGENIYGDGVNVASRVESLGIPGSVLVSEKVHDELKNQEGLTTRALGFFEFKNVNHPVQVFALTNEGLVVPRRQELSGKTRTPQNRIAVLPFVNMSPDADNEFFSDGITEELLNALTKVENIQVTSRTSAFAFKGKNIDIREIGIQLQVDRILEGSVRKSGNRIRVTAQLINASDGYHIWSENFDRDLTDIFAIQDEISAMIAAKFRSNILDKTEVPSTYANVEAYTFYLKGLHFWNKLTPSDARQAIACFEQAISIHPHYAQAYAMVASAYSYLGSSGQMTPSVAFENVKKFADKALELDPTVAEGHIAQGGKYLFYDWNWKAAHTSLQKAIDLNPAATSAYQLLSVYHVISGHKEQALAIMEDAVKHDPLSPQINHYLGSMYVFNGRYADAIQCADQLIEMNPGMRAAIEMKAWATGMSGDWNAALTLFREVHRLTNHPLKGLMGLGYAFAKVGDTASAMECIHKIEQRQRESPDIVLDGDLVGIWYALGDFDKTFHYIEQCIMKRTTPPALFLEYPTFEELRSDSRYSKIRRLQGLSTSDENL
jgi:adenylate cyclase